MQTSGSFAQLVHDLLKMQVYECTRVQVLRFSVLNVWTCSGVAPLQTLPRPPGKNTQAAAVYSGISFKPKAPAQIRLRKIADKERPNYTVPFHAPALQLGEIAPQPAPQISSGVSGVRGLLGFLRLYVWTGGEDHSGRAT